MRPQARLVLWTITAAVLAVPQYARLGAQSPNATVVISQVYGGGGNAGATYTHDFVELFNRSANPIDVSGWSVQYASGTGNFGALAGSTVPLSGVIPAGGYFLVRMAQGAGGTTPLPAPDALGNAAMSATSGKVVLANVPTSLACNGTTAACMPSQIEDLVGYGPMATFLEGSAQAPQLSNTTAALRAGEGCADTNENANDFTAAAPAPRNSASATIVCETTGGGSTDMTVTVDQATAAATQLEPVVVTATVQPGTDPPSTGIVVIADLSGVAVGGTFDQPLLDDGVAPDAVAGDLVFTTSFILLPTLVEDLYTFGVAAFDAEGRSASSVGELLVTPPPTVFMPHEVQGAGATSPVAGHSALVQGVVTARKFNGFFMQTESGREDSDPNTSEGLFVFTSTAPPPEAIVGDLVRVSGVVTEFGDPPLTELASVAYVSNLGVAGVPDATPLGAVELSPSGPFDQLERFEGMRVSVASLTAVTGTGGFVSEAQATSTSDGAFYTVLTGQARPFREPGIEVLLAVLPCAVAPAPCNIPVFDGNPERLRVDSDALENMTAVEVSSGAVMTDVTGVMDFSSRAYTLLPETQLVPSGGLTATSVPVAGADQFTVASLNLQRFFDTANDPHAADVVMDSTAYQNRLAKASLLVRTSLRLPDILGVQDVENQATLEALANQINADAVAASGADPQYSAHLFEGHDPGGIDVGFLVKGSRVDVLAIAQVGFDATFTDPSDGSEDLLHDRPPVVLEALVHGPATMLPAAVTVINNHLRSLNDVDDDSPTGARVRAKRQAQAEFLANFVQGRQVANPSEAIVSIGLYNAFSFNDGYGDLIGTIRGVPTPGDEAVTASPDLVDPDLVELEEASALERYSHLFDGHAQTVDHVLVTANLMPQFDALVHARVNADFPESMRGDFGRPERLAEHDPVVAFFSFPPDVTAPVLSGVSDVTAEGNTLGGAVVSYPTPTATDNLDGVVPVTCAPASGSLFPVQSTGVTCTATDAAGNSASVTFSVTVTDTQPPSLTLPPSMTAVSVSPDGTAVTFVATATDVVSGTIAPLCAPVSGSVFPVGTTTVACVASDASGNSSSGSFPVTVSFQPPAPGSSPGYLVGHGLVGSHSTGVKFTFEAKQLKNGTSRGSLYLLFQDKPRRKFESTMVTSTRFWNEPDVLPGRKQQRLNDSVQFTGVGRWNGQPGYTFEAQARDAGEGRHSRDTLSVVVKAPNGEVVARFRGVLNDGNIQALPQLR